MRSVLTRDRLGRRLRSRWLFAAVVLAVVLGTIVILQSRQLALAADTHGATEAVSVSNSNVVGAKLSDSPAISGDGRFVAFRTDTAFDPVDASGGTDSDIYVRDTVAGTTTLITVGRDGDGNPVPSIGGNSAPSISKTGRYIAFVTKDPLFLHPKANQQINYATVAICDRGVPDAGGGFGPICKFTSLLSGTGGDASEPTISADGSRLSYLENQGLDGTFATVVNLTIDNTGAMSDPTSTDFRQPPEPQKLGSRFIGNPNGGGDTAVTLSTNGRYLVRTTQYFLSGATPAAVTALWVNDLNGDPAALPTRLDFEVPPPTSPPTFVGDSGDLLEEPAVSGDGRRIAFTDNTGNVPRRIVHTIDRDPNGTGTFGPGTGQPVAVDVVSKNVSGTVVGGRMPAFSADGRYLAFVTDAAHIHNGLDDARKNSSCIQPKSQGLSNCDVVVRDLVQDAQRAAAGLPRLPAELASPSQQSTLPGTKPPVTCPTVCEGDGDSTTPVVDADGSAVAYASLADNLLANGADNNHVGDVFKRTFKPVPVVPSLNFGNVLVHTPVTGTVTVSYPDAGTGFGPLHITGVAIAGTNGGDFTVFPTDTCTGVTLLPGDTCTVSIQFTPGDVGGRNGTLSITTITNVQGRGNLSGNGTSPTLVASPPLAPPGAVSQVSGTGWPPNEVVVVTLLTTPIQVKVTASATGTFTVPLVIFPHTALGKKQLQAQVQAIPQVSKTIDYLVVPGSLLPPDFAQRR